MWIVVLAVIAVVVIFYVINQRKKEDEQWQTDYESKATNTETKYVDEEEKKKRMDELNALKPLLEPYVQAAAQALKEHASNRDFKSGAEIAAGIEKENAAYEAAKKKIANIPGLSSMEKYHLEQYVRQAAREYRRKL